MRFEDIEFGPYLVSGRLEWYWEPGDAGEPVLAGPNVIVEYVLDENDAPATFPEDLLPALREELINRACDC